jgi:hypothetical protein
MRGYELSDREVAIYQNPDVWDMELVWMEDDATLSDPTAEHLEGALKRTFGISWKAYLKCPGPIAFWDGGDFMQYFIPVHFGKTMICVVCSYDGASIYRCVRLRNRRNSRRKR